ncbi:FtsX-like permease family protein [Streptomyces sp. NPDC004111]|uniref:FtsX-like permease family protein n=1 Tax=Streptomyces sp. NPDC004111 TaxID=3364690 RepID=UPI00369CAA79
MSKSRPADVARALGLGCRFALGGGREGWVRTALTALGVGLGVTLLLVAVAVPHAMSAREDREAARSASSMGQIAQPRPDTLLITQADTAYRDSNVRGRYIKAEGPDAPPPPGLTAYPGDGELAVSPALDALFRTEPGKLLRERLPGRITAVIGDEGLLGPAELAFYRGDSTLKVDGMKVSRVDGFDSGRQLSYDPTLLLLIVVTFVVLLVPIGVFIAAAVRFGGERRDRRLAALRLVGADSGTVRLIAAGEALAGALIGLVVGGGFFLLARSLADRITFGAAGAGLFPADLTPVLPLILLVALAVPAAAVGVSLLAMRGVVIEPLGVVRTARPVRRRVWWRLLLPAAGVALLFPLIGGGRETEVNQNQLIGGTVLLLLGVTALLPWLVEAFVARLGGGSTSWQLAVRRLQMNSGVAARTVNGIAVAVAGAIALHMLLGGIDDRYVTETGADPNRAQLGTMIPDSSPAARDAGRLGAEIARTPGVEKYMGFGVVAVGTSAKSPEERHEASIADCATLREVAKLPSCKDGDVFISKGGEMGDPSAAYGPGRTVYLRPADFESMPRVGVSADTPPTRWKMPANTRHVTPVPDPGGSARGGLFITPGALPPLAPGSLALSMYVKVAPGDADAVERVRNVLAKADPGVTAYGTTATESDRRFATVQKGLYAGATCVLLLIGVSLLVSQLEQLRERRKLLSVLVAFGTRRSTLGRSVLWQTAVPMVLGLLLAMAVGVGLGLILLAMSEVPAAVDWAGVAAMTGIGGGVVLLVGLLSLPPLWRLMRPDGLRTE